MRIKRRDDFQRGFTLVELLVAMAISGIVMAAVYSSYSSQQRSYVTQEQVAVMQQNLRGALFNLEREIRSAGYQDRPGSGAGVLTAQANRIRIGMDLNRNGNILDTNEDVTYAPTVSNGINCLGRDTGGGLQPVIENIDALDFVYLNSSRSETATLADIRSVQITVVARAERADPRYTDTQSYSNQLGRVILPAPNDNFRRKILTTEVKCRNLGLQ